MDEIIYDRKSTPFPITPFMGVVFLLWALHGGSVALVEEWKPRVFVCRHLLVCLRRGHRFLVGIFERSAEQHMGGIFCGGMYPVCPKNLGA